MSPQQLFFYIPPAPPDAIPNNEIINKNTIDHDNLHYKNNSIAKLSLNIQSIRNTQIQVEGLLCDDLC